MSYAEIESELDKLDSDELRRLALKSWTAFVQREGLVAGTNECDENDPALLSALDDAIVRADRTPGQGCSGGDLRARLDKWTSR